MHSIAVFVCLGSFGTQRWGPSGMSAPPPVEPAGRQYSNHSGAGAALGREARSSSFGSSTRDRRDSGGNRGSFGNGPPPYQSQQQQQYQQHRASGQFGGAPQNAQSPPAPKQAAQMKKQQEINLIDDFGPSVSVPAQSLLFDPLAGVRSSRIYDCEPDLLRVCADMFVCLLVCCAVDICCANRCESTSAATDANEQRSHIEQPSVRSAVQCADPAQPSAVRDFYQVTYRGCSHVEY